MAGTTLSSRPGASVAGNTLISRRPTLINSLLGAVMAGCVLTAGQAKALTVSVGGFDYDVTTFTGSYNDNASKFTTTNMPWWGSGVAAYGIWAPLVGTSLGLPNNQGDYGPMFGYGFSPGFGFPYVNFASFHLGVTWTGTSPLWFGSQYGETWAQASLVGPTGGGGGGSTSGDTASVPGPLPILGLGVAFGFSRQLRKRIKLHREASSVTRSLGT